ncbi:MAG: DUF3592 domain-containing protein, partial [Candidatus Saccharimonas sp.]
MSSNETKKVGVKAFRNRGIIFAILAIVLIIAGSIWIAKPFNDFLKRQTWKQTEGQIYGFEKKIINEKTGEYRYSAVIDFSVKENETIEFRSELKNEKPVIGVKVKVFYDEKDPNSAVEGDFEIIKIVAPSGLLIVGIISAVLAMI